MSHYMQLLGTDVPNSYGGCCYYGPIDHPAFQNTPEQTPAPRATSPPPPSTAPSTTASASCATSFPRVFEAYCHTPHRAPTTTSSGATGSEGYLFFNCPEGVQRFSSEANIKLGRVKGFLFTRFTTPASVDLTEKVEKTETSESVMEAGLSSDAWFTETRQMGAASAVMGLPGLLFTINDAGVRSAHLFGPSSCCHAQHSTGPRQQNLNALVPATTTDASTLDVSVVAPSGVERFVVALRKHYFTHRPMRFRLLCPTLVPGTTAVSTTRGTSSAVRDDHTTTAVSAPCADGEGRGPMVCVTQTEGYRSTLPTLYTQDEILPIATPLTTTTAPFIVAVMQLSSRSLLVAFRVSGAAVRSEALDASAPAPSWSWAETSDLVLGYAIVHAPPPTFDAQRARALGVLPGKKFGLLKEGQAVRADVESTLHATSPSHPDPPRAKRARDEAGPTEGPTGTPLEATAARTEGRWVEPHEVTRDTIASRHLYLSLVLDGDRPEDVQQAIGRLLDRELEAVLAAWWPDLLRPRGTHAHSPPDEATQENAGSPLPPPPPVRTLVLRHVIHLHPRSYFAGFAAWRKETTTTALAADNVFDAYTHFLFDPLTTTPAPTSHSSHTPCAASSPTSLRASLQLSVSPSLFAASPPPGSPSAASPPALTHHVFSADVSARYTAYPTALAHRYHLHLLAPTLFPMRAGAPSLTARATHETRAPSATAAKNEEASETKEEAEARVNTAIPALSADAPDEVWPYSYKLRCIPEDSLAWWDPSAAPQSGDSQPNTSSPSPSPSPTAAKPAPSKKDKKQQRRTTTSTEDFSNNGAALIRYPSAQSAVALLTDAFCQREAAALARIEAASSASSASFSHVPTDRSDPKSMAKSSAWSADSEDGGGALVFLGTGSAVPSKHRNVSGTYLELHLPGYCLGRDDEPRTSQQGQEANSAAVCRRGIVILDFGEGSGGQLATLLQHRRQRRGPGLSVATSPLTHSAGEAIDVGEDGEADEDALAQFVSDIILVFISHAHADHHLGLTTLLSLRHYYHRCAPQPRRATALPVLLVVCPREVYEYVMDTWGCEDPYKSWLTTEVVFDCMPSAYALRTSTGPLVSSVSAETAPQTSQSTAAALSVPTCLPRLAAWLRKMNAAIVAAEAGLFSSDHSSPSTLSHLPMYWDADVFTVDHPANAHALLLRFPSLLPAASHTTSSRLHSKVFLFSGDTRPCEEIVARSRRFCRTAQGERISICLHEATFGPGYEAEALRKKHSTLPEALRVGREWLQAESIVLNHFSQRYPKLPGLTDEHLGGVKVDLQCRRRGTAGGGGGGDDDGDDDDDDGAKTADADGEACRDALLETEAQNVEDTHGPAQSVHAGRDMCFAFDLMRLPFSAMRSGLPASLTPSFVRLLEEYESWTTGTTQRLRE